LGETYKCRRIKGKLPFCKSRPTKQSYFYFSIKKGCRRSTPEAKASFLGWVFLQKRTVPFEGAAPFVA
jgi:hypothetical protein